MSIKTKKLSEFLCELNQINTNIHNINYISIRNEKKEIPNDKELYNLWASWWINDAIQKWKAKDWTMQYNTHLLYHFSNKNINFNKIIKYLKENLNKHTPWNEYSIDYSVIKNIEIIKSPVNYDKPWLYNDCKSNDCREKYWPQWCWFNYEESLKMMKNSDFDFFWKHDRKEKKEYHFKKNFSWQNCIYVPDEYVFQIWNNNWKVILDFWLKFTEYWGIVFPESQMDNIIKKLKSYGFKEKQ
jgi:hypothetical protein